MPLLKIETTVPPPEEKGKLLLAAFSKGVAGTIGKPEQYVMVTVNHSAMLMSGWSPARTDVKGASVAVN